MTRPTFARWLRGTREARGLTRLALAERLGSHRRTVEDWELGGAIPSVLLLAAIAEWADVDPGALVRLVVAGGDVGRAVAE